MAAPQTTALPQAPQRNEPEAQFIQKSNAFIASLEPFRQQLQSQADFIGLVYEGVPEVYEIAAEVQAVAGISADVTAVASNETNITTAAQSIADIQAAPQAAIDAQASATAASNSASAAASAALLGANIYAITADGLAATADGDYFSVQSPAADEYLILYRNDAGVATEIDTYPNKQAVDDAVAELNTGLADVNAALADVNAALADRVIYVDSIADLLALNTAALKDGQQVSVLSYHAPVWGMAQFMGAGSSLGMLSSPNLSTTEGGP
ncbi:MAG: hypothetical protein CL583_07370 [Alteromonadaceae bacterium]|nr:hypothetical protein [Alteromonadaceae bacterium]|tara:strand:- start:9023 stop:9826 length:804 start_codon:yes stop_codon:yes gene_type:complete